MSPKGLCHVDPNVAYCSSESWDSEMLERMRWLREHDPVFWSEADGVWVVSRYEDVVRVSKDQDLFTSGQGVRPGNPTKIGLIDEGEPRHSQLRRLINRGFTPRMVRVLELSFRQIVKECLDKVTPCGRCDFVEDLAVPLPLLVIAEMIGIRPEDRDRFHKWSDDMIGAEGRLHEPEVMARAGAAFAEYAAYVHEIIEARRREPCGDLVSILVGAEDEGFLEHAEDSPDGSQEKVELANDELTMLLVILLVAGNETTRNGISGGMQLLIENPGERRKLIDDPSLLRGAVEEMVRVVSPVHSFSRTVTRDTELHDRALKQGDKVLLLYPSANRDDRVFEDPDVFKVERNPQHVGFGVGSHFCLGANLARMEMRVAFEEILRRMPDAEYADGGPVIVPSALVRSCTKMELRFTPER